MLWFNIITTYVNIAILRYMGRGEGRAESVEGRGEKKKRRGEMGEEESERGHKKVITL